MSSLSELRNYKATEKSLSDRLSLLRTKEAARHTDWRECFDSEGWYVDGITKEIADVKFAAWTLAIDRANQTNQALGIISAIIREIEGN